MLLDCFPGEEIRITARDLLHSDEGPVTAGATVEIVLIDPAGTVVATKTATNGTGGDDWYADFVAPDAPGAYGFTITATKTGATAKGRDQIRVKPWAFAPTAPVWPPPSPLGAPFVVAAGDAGPGWTDAAAYVCDGANDEVQIQAALDALPDGGGIVTLSPGTFNVAATVVLSRHNAGIVGAGCGQRTGSTQAGVGTKLQAVPGLTGAVIRIDSGVNPPVYGALLRDFAIDGAYVGTGTHGILDRSNRSFLDHVHVHRMTGAGIVLRGFATVTDGFNWDTYDSHVTHCQVGDCLDTGNPATATSGQGIWLDHDATDCHLVSCILFNNYDNFLMRAGSVQVTACHTYDAVRYNVFFDSAGSRSKLSNCKIEGAGSHNLAIDSTRLAVGTSDIVVTGCNFKNAGDAADNSADHVWIGGPTAGGHTRTTIVGNTFSYQSSVTPNRPRYAINLDGSAAQTTLITGNSFGPAAHWGTGVLRDNGNDAAPAVIVGNQGLPDKILSALNVKASPFNAKGDGIVDDTAALQAALDAVPATGGVVYLPPGDYEIAAPLVVSKHGTVLLGAGSGHHVGATQDAAVSRIQVDAAFVGTEAIRCQWPANDRTLYGVAIRHLTIDGQSSGAGIDGIVAQLTHGAIEDVALHRLTGDGVIVVGYPTWKARDNVFRDVHADTLTGAACVFGADSLANAVENGVIDTCGTGISVLAPEVRVRGTAILSGTGDGIVFAGAGSRSSVANCRIENNAHNGILLDTTTAAFSDVLVTGCGFKNNGNAATNTYGQLATAGPSGNALSRLLVTGCQFFYVSGESANQPQYGVNLSSNVQNGVVAGNTFGPASHFGTASVRDSSASGAPALVQANAGWATERGGVATVANGATIAHGLAKTPTWYQGTSRVAGHIVAITAVDATNLTVAIHNNDGTAIAVAEGVSWWAKVG